MLFCFDISVNFKYKEQTYSLKAIEAAPNHFDYFQVALSQITLEGFTSLKTQILERFLVYGKVPDIVLYDDNPTGSWFTGNGYIIIRYKRRSNYDHNKPEMNYFSLYPYQPKVSPVWTQLSEYQLDGFNIKNKLN